MNPQPSSYPVRPTYSSGTAIVSMILGILGLCGPILSIPAVICGHVAINSIRKSKGTTGGTGFAVTGLVTGYIGVAMLAAIGGLIGLGALASSSSEQQAGELFPLEKTPVPNLPDLPEEFLVLEPSKVRVSQIQLDGSGPGGKMQLRIYLPAEPAGDKTLPCVLVAPAGTNLLQGNHLDSLGPDSYHDEALPYAKAGMAAIFYSIDGGVPEGEDEEDLEVVKKAYDAFRAAGAGTVNGRNALEFATAKMPMVDPQRIFAAGHSSAGTLALLMAAHEDRLKGAVAYAPCGDVEKFHTDLIESPGAGLLLSDVRNFIKRSSPRTHLGKASCPVFLFYANDDSMVSKEDADAFIAAVREQSVRLNVRRVSSGGHYRSMIRDGIPAGIEWMKSR